MGVRAWAGALSVAVIGGGIVAVFTVHYQRATEPTKPEPAKSEPQRLPPQPARNFEQPNPTRAPLGVPQGPAVPVPKTAAAPNLRRTSPNADLLAPSRPASEQPTVMMNTEDRAQILDNLRYYAEKLDHDPGDRRSASAYATQLPKLVTLRDSEMACTSLQHWENYARHDCSMLERAVLETVDAQLDALRALCTKATLDHASLRKCAS